jgi:hypothetical protein
MMRNPKRHHTVPQFLLRHFAFGKKRNRICIYDKWEDKVIKTTVANTAVEARFYEFDCGDGHIASLEESLSRLESRASIVVNKVLAAGSAAGLEPEDRVTLAALVAAQFLRTSGLQERVAETDKVIEGRLIAEGADPTAVKLCVPGCDPSQAPNYHRLSQDEIKAMAMRLMSNLTQECAAVLTLKRWCLLRAKRPVLHISDHPVCLDNGVDMSPCGNLGLLVKGVEVYMPLSPSYCLGMFCPEVHAGIPEVLELQPEDVDRLNCLQTAFGTRWVYACSPDFTFARKFLDQHPGARRPQRIATV